MNETLKNSVLEIAELLKSLPEVIQPRAFEMLLSNELDSQDHPPKIIKTKKPVEDQQESGDEAPSNVDHDNDTEDIVSTNLHVKARKFLDKHSLTLKDVNGLFYKDGDQFVPLYEDLKTTKTSESQIRIALLLAFRHGMQNGDFEFSGETVRQECVTKKCYDAANFTRNFNNSASMFDGFESYSKTSPTVKINEEGKKTLAALVKELQ